MAFAPEFTMSSTPDSMRRGAAPVQLPPAGALPESLHGMPAHDAREGDARSSEARNGDAPTTLASLRDWVASVAALTQPARIEWCDGSDAENERLVALMLDTGDLLR
jgi:hypothetical protein